MDHSIDSFLDRLNSFKVISEGKRKSISIQPVLFLIPELPKSFIEKCPERGQGSYRNIIW
jgi:hypothetical protein